MIDTDNLNPVAKRFAERLIAAKKKGLRKEFDRSTSSLSEFVAELLTEFEAMLFNRVKLGISDTLFNQITSERDLFISALDWFSEYGDMQFGHAINYENNSSGLARTGWASQQNMSLLNALVFCLRAGYLLDSPEFRKKLDRSSMAAADAKKGVHKQIETRKKKEEAWKVQARQFASGLWNDLPLQTQSKLIDELVNKWEEHFGSKRPVGDESMRKLVAKMSRNGDLPKRKKTQKKVTKGLR